MQEEYYGKEVTIADREMVESSIEIILDNADAEDVAFLVVGDPFGCEALSISIRGHSTPRAHKLNIQLLMHACLSAR